MDRHARRVGENEAVFRDANERVRAVSEGFQITQAGEFLCECGDDACLERIAMSLVEYEAVRAEPTRFVLRPGHEDPRVERVIADHGHFVVVEKLEGVPSSLAAAEDAGR